MKLTRKLPKVVKSRLVSNPFQLASINWLMDQVAHDNRLARLRRARVKAELRAALMVPGRDYF
jgi:hypothetical protein